MDNTKAIKKGKSIKAVFNVPGSKSITNRALCLAALSDKEILISEPLLSRDTEAFKSCITRLGGSVKDSEKRWAVTPVPGNVDAHVYAADAGTAGRFIPPLVAAVGGNVSIDGSEQLRARPMADLVQALRQLNVDVDGQSFPMSLSGTGLYGGEIHLSGKTSSQFLSGLLMALPLSKKKTTICVEDLVSKPYVDMTISMMNQFGSRVERKEYSFFSIEPTGRYSPSFSTLVVEADASTASYFFAAAMVTGSDIVVRNLSLDALQGDIGLLKIFESMGAVVYAVDNGVGIIGPKAMPGISVDMNDMTDVFMTLAAVAPLCTSPTRIENIGHARLKECDRIDAMYVGLQKAGVDVSVGPDWIEINPSVLKHAVIDPRNDHRIAMSFSVLGLAGSGIEIADPGCVSKTCPEFYELFSPFEEC